METMKALVFKEPWKIDLEEVPIPRVKEKNQVLIKITAFGICGSDIKILEGKHAYNSNIILGHEFDGTPGGLPFENPPIIHCHSPTGSG